MRDGAITLSNFYDSMKAIDACTEKCDEVFVELDRKFIRQARSLFSETFPDAKLIRNAVAHEAETSGTPEKVDRHKYAGVLQTGSAKMSGMIPSSVERHRYCASFRGKLVCYELTEEAMSKLERVKDAYWAAYQPFAIK